MRCSKSTIVPVRATPAIPLRRSGKTISAPRISKTIYATCRRSRHAAFALHAPSLLREPVPVLRLQCLHPERQARRHSLPRRAEKRNRARLAERFAKRQVIQFHWGGGTPTYLSPAQMEELFAHTRERFHSRPTRKSASKSIRASPARAHLETLRRLGFNRLSMGIQDFQPAGAANHPSRAALRNDPRLDPRRARAGFRKPERRFDLRPALPNRRKLSATRSRRRSRSFPIAWRCSATRMCPG